MSYFTLERCFQGSDDFSTLEKVRQVEFAPVRSVNRAVPPELERIVHKGLQNRHAHGFSRLRVS